MIALQTPASHGHGYTADVAGFAAARGSRRLFLRRARADDGEAVVLVIELAPGVHAVEPIWRGEPFWPTKVIAGYLVVEDDAAVIAVVEECARRGGKAAPAPTRGR